MKSFDGHQAWVGSDRTGSDSPNTRLKIEVLRFRLAPRTVLIVPAVNKGNMLRGGFGHAFRHLCCIPECRDAKSCPIAGRCPYELVFEPSPPPGSNRLSMNQDIPRPFVFRPPRSAKTHYERGEDFEFELVLIGHTFDFLPYFVLSIRELAEHGLGLNQARCTLDEVVELSIENSPQELSERPKSVARLVYSGKDQLFRSVSGTDSREWTRARLREVQSESGSQSEIRMTFLTPTWIKAGGQVISDPKFHHIIKRLRDRTNALSTFYGDGPLEVDFRGMGERSEKIRKVEARFEWVDRSRTSGKTGQRHELSGFVGEAIFRGELSEFLPWLVTGEFVHVGKHAPWGNGQFVIDSTRPELS